MIGDNHQLRDVANADQTSALAVSTRGRSSRSFPCGTTVFCVGERMRSAPCWAGGTSPERHLSERKPAERHHHRRHFQRGRLHATWHHGRPAQCAGSGYQTSAGSGRVPHGIFQKSDFTHPQRGSCGYCSPATHSVGPATRNWTCRWPRDSHQRTISSQIRLDSFNAFNRVNLNNPSATWQ